MYVREEKSRCSLSKPFCYTNCFLIDSASDLGLHSAAKLSLEQERPLPLGRAPGAQPGAMAASRAAEVRREPGLELEPEPEPSFRPVAGKLLPGSEAAQMDPQGGCRGPGVGAPHVIQQKLWKEVSAEPLCPGRCLHQPGLCSHPEPSRAGTAHPGEVVCVVFTGGEF